MKSLITLTAAAALSVFAAYGALAEEFTKGTVKKLDVAAKKVTLIHEELKALGMPAMTMVFRVEDEAILQKLKEGDKIQFVAERANGKLTVTQVK